MADDDGLEPPEYGVVDPSVVSADPAGILSKIDRLVDMDDGPRASVWAQGYAMACYSDMALFGQHFDAIKAVLLKVSDKDLSDSPPAEDAEDGRVKMAAVLGAFLPVLSMLSAAPAPGAPPDAIPQLMPVCLNVLGNPDLPTTAMMAYGPITTAMAYDGDAMLPHLPQMFDVMRAAEARGAAAGPSGVDMLMGVVTMSAAKDPATFFANMDVMIGKLDGVYGASVLSAFWELSKTETAPFLPYLPRLAELLRNPTGFQAMYVLHEVAQTHPHEVADVMDTILDSWDIWTNLDNPPIYMAAGVFGSVGKRVDGQRYRMLQALGQLLVRPNVQRDDLGAAAVADNMKALCEDEAADLEDYVEALTTLEEGGGGHAQKSAADALDYYRGRDVSALHGRVDNVEAAAASLNSQLEELDISQYKAYIDAHMDQVKDFIGGVQKALPVPVRMQITGGESWAIHKQIRLYFQCCRQIEGAKCTYPEGNEFYTLTEDWGRWLKMGMGLVNAGVSLLDFASAPIDAIEGSMEGFQEIFDAYNEDDEQDFQNFMSAPFLEAAERDKLIEQLRDEQFFDKFEYDSQCASWCCRKCNEFIQANKSAVAIDEMEAELQMSSGQRKSITLQLSQAVGGVFGGGRDKPKAKGEMKKGGSIMFGLGSSGGGRKDGDDLPPLPAFTAFASEAAVAEALAIKGLDIWVKAKHVDDPTCHLYEHEDEELDWDQKTKLYEVFGCDDGGGLTASVDLQLVFGFLQDVTYSYTARQVVAEAFDRYNSYPPSLQRKLQAPEAQLVTAWAHITRSTLHDKVAGSLAMAVFGPLQQDMMGYPQRHADEMAMLCSALGHIADADVRECFADAAASAQDFMGSINTNAMVYLYSYPSLAGNEANTGLVPVLAKFLRNWDHEELRESCVNGLAPFKRTSPHLIEECVDDIIYAIYHGCGEAIQLLDQAIKNEPEELYPHLQAFIALAEDDIDLTRHVVLVLKNYADTGDDHIIEVLDYCKYVSVDNVSGSSYWAFGALVPMARLHPEVVYEHLYALEAAVQASTQSMHQNYAAILGACAATSDAHAVHVVPMVMAPISNPSMDPMEAAYYLAEIRGVAARLGPGVLRGHVGVIKAWRRSTGMAAEAAEDIMRIYEGRDAASLALRVVDLEDRVQSFNGMVVESCTDFEDVKEFLDARVRELKGFVGDVVKTLPAPVAVSVAGTVRKALMLSFVCCRCGPNCRANAGNPFTTLTREWDKWLRMGFLLLSAGSAVIDVGLGNPLGLIQTTYGIVRGIFDAYNEDPEADFNTFISEPFLTSAENDKLVDQLRDAEFFEHFAYDAEEAAWCCRECVAKEPGLAPRSPKVGAEASKENGHRSGHSNGPADGHADGKTGVPPPAPYEAAVIDVPDVPDLEAEASKYLDGDAPPALDYFKGMATVDDLEEDPPEEFESYMDTLFLPQIPDAYKARELFSSGLDAAWYVLFHPDVAPKVKKVAFDRFQIQHDQLDENHKAAFRDSLPALCVLLAALVSDGAELSEDALGLIEKVAELLQQTTVQLPKAEAGFVTMQVVGAIAALVRRAENADNETAAALGDAVNGLLNGIYATVTKNTRALYIVVPLMFRVLANRKCGDSVHSQANGIISTAAYSVPRVVGRHVDDVFSLLRAAGVGGKSDGLGHVLPQLYVYKPDTYLQPQNLRLLTDICKAEPATQRISYVNAYHNISKDNATALVPYLDFLVDLLINTGIAGSLLVMTLGSVAAADPLAAEEVLLPRLDELERACLGLTAMDFFYIPILGGIGRGSTAAAQAVLPRLFGLLEDKGGSGNALLSALVLLQVKAVVSGERELLEPHIEAVRGILADGGAKAAIVALELVQFYEGRGIDALARRVSDVAADVVDVEERTDPAAAVRAYIADHEHDVKEFLAIIAKKLPEPVRMSVEGRARKSLFLYFRCGRQEAGRCAHPEGMELRTETQAWGKWVKVALNLANVGRHVLSVPGSPLEGIEATIEAVRNTAGLLSEADDDVLSAYTDEPFLTSEEQDQLIVQLKEGGFFDAFGYAPQEASWVCDGCKHDDEVKGEDGVLVTGSRVQRDRDDPTAAPDVVQGRFAKAVEHAERAREPPAPAAQNGDDNAAKPQPVKQGCTCKCVIS